MARGFQAQTDRTISYSFNSLKINMISRLSPYRTSASLAEIVLGHKTAKDGIDMKRIVLAAVMVLAAVSFARPAEATPRGSFGMGIIVGEPTGLDLKWFLNDVNAIEGAVAWSFSGDTDVHIQVDYLYHFYDWIKVSKGLLPVFMGVGGRVAFRENHDDKLGIRIPVGISYEFDGGVVDVFGELVPVLDLAPDTDFDFEGALGARFWF
jgi:hypothetical protein